MTENKDIIVLFVMVNSIGHLNPSFALAKKLSSNTHAKVIFLSPLDTVEIIQSNGFEYVSCSTIIFKGVTPYTDDTGFWSRLASVLSNQGLKFAKENGDIFSETVAEINPDIVLLDSMLSYNFLYLRNKYPVILILSSPEIGLHSHWP